MADGEVTSIPLAGEGSQTPGQVPSLHTPIGEGADTTGVNNIGKTPGAAGAPPKGIAPMAGGGAPGVGMPGEAGKKPGVPPIPQKSPEQILDERSEKRLQSDIEDILITHESQTNHTIKTGKISLDELGLEMLIKRLVDEKGWRVDRLKELLPSRDEQGIMEYFDNLLNKDLNKKPDVNPVIQPVTDNTRRSSMNKQDILVNDGKLESVLNITDSLNQLSFAVDSAAQARRQLQDAIIKQAGIDSLGEGLGLGMKDDMSMGGGMGMGGGIGGIDVPSKENELKDALRKLTEVLKKFLDERGGGKLDADSAIKSDMMIDKGKGELGKGNSMLSGLNKPKPEAPKPAPSGPPTGPSAGVPAPEKKEEKKPMPGVAAATDTTVKTAETVEEEAKKEGETEEEEKKEQEKTAMDAAAGGKKVNITSHEAAKPANQPLGGAGGKGGDPMKATLEAKAQVLEKIKEKANQIAELKKQAQLYPFSQKKQYDFPDINAQKAGEQASEINTDISSGEMVKDKTDKFLGQSREKGTTNLPSDPGMDVSKPYNKAAMQQEVDETVSKIRLAIEVASVQQLKGLISNPLKEAMVKNMEEIGITKEAAETIAYNTFFEGYEASQREVMAEAFETLAKQDFNEFVKVANFTKKYNGELNTSVKEEGKDKPQVKTASEKQSVALRGSQVSKVDDDKFGKFWRQAYAEQRSGK